MKAYPKATYWTAAGIGIENVKKPTIVEYFKNNSQIAADTVMDLVKWKKIPAAVKLNACKDVLDRAGYKLVEQSKVEHTGLENIKSISVTINDEW